MNLVYQQQQKLENENQMILENKNMVCLCVLGTLTEESYGVQKQNHAAHGDIFIRQTITQIQ